jgi:putative endonuclease
LRPCHFEGAAATEKSRRFLPVIAARNDKARGFMKEYNFYVYILTNWNNEVMYIGLTNNLERRIHEHKNKLVEGFTAKYNINKLVYYEHGTDVHAAMAREKEIKKWRREKKNDLVMTMNSEWKDLSLEWELDEPR